MLRIDKDQKKLVLLEKSSLVKAEHWERDLQAMICTEPDAFCEEIGESLWIIGKEVQPSDAIADRIDILAIDESGKSVVIELKRGSHKLQLMQALSYAGMISGWEPDDFIRTLSENYHQSKDDAQAAIEYHIRSDISSINHDQRVLLIAEDFDPALLMATEWLHEKHGVDIRCYRLQLSHENNSDYLTCTCVYPPIEIATLTRGADKSGHTSAAWTDWNSALEAVENPAVTDYFRSELAAHQEARLSTRELLYRIDGKRRFWVNVRKKYAYVWQWGRFDGDDSFWRNTLSKPDHVQKVRKDRALRFHLVTPADFAAFNKAAKGDLLKAEFSEELDFDGAPD